MEGYAEPELASLLAEPANASYRPEPRGLYRAREALARHRQAGLARALDPGRYFLSSSTSEAYSWLFKLLCDPGDVILVPKPGYPLFEYLAGLECVEARPWRLEYLHPRGWRIDLDSLEAAVAAPPAAPGGRVRALVLINPNNPTGSYVGAEEREALLALAARHGLALIVDEVFLPFALEGGGSSFEGEERVLTFVLDGLSKSLGLPQLKLGWIAASGPAELLSEACERLEIIADSYLSAGAPAMNALPALLEAAPRFAAALRRRMTRNLDRLRSVLGGDDSPHRVYRCEGGWTALIESPRFRSEEETALSLLREEGLWVQPGHFFDMEREPLFAASLILPEDAFAEGLGRYAAWFAREGG